MGSRILTHRKTSGVERPWFKCIPRGEAAPEDVPRAGRPWGEMFAKQQRPSHGDPRHVSPYIKTELVTSEKVRVHGQWLSHRGLFLANKSASCPVENPPIDDTRECSEAVRRGPAAATIVWRREAAEKPQRAGNLHIFKAQWAHEEGDRTFGNLLGGLGTLACAAPCGASIRKGARRGVPL